MSTVEEILLKKGHSVETIAPEATVLDAARRMNAVRIGAIVVTKNDKVVGILSERDILTRVIAPQLEPAKTAVREVMTTQVAYCEKETALERCRHLMTDQRIRHLPVLDEGKLTGIVTIGDLMAWQAAEQGETIRHLNQYIYGTR